MERMRDLLLRRGLGRRVLLYGGLLSVVWAGTRYGRALAEEAREAEEAAPASPLVLEGTLGRGRLYDTLVEAGLTAQEAALASKALRKTLNTRRLDPADRWMVVRSSAGEFHHLTVVHGLRRHVVTRAESGFVSRSNPLPIGAETRRATGTVSGSLWLSMESQGVPPPVILAFADAFQWTVDFLSDTRDGDEFSVLWSERRTPDGRVIDRAVEFALYEGPAAGRREGVLFEGQYYDEDGQSLERQFLKAPLQFRRISSGFNTRRRHPILRVNRPHHGTDYAAPRGTPVSSIGNGTVIFAGRKGGFGNCVEIRHDNTYSTLYGHLTRIKTRRGARVTQGQVIGTVGSTGLASGPHLHFQISKRGRWVDFLRLRLPFARALPSSRRAEFAAFRERLLKELAGPGV